MNVGSFLFGQVTRIEIFEKSSLMKENRNIPKKLGLFQLLIILLKKVVNDFWNRRTERSGRGVLFVRLLEHL